MNRYCSRCGKMIQGNGNFCSGCGAPIMNSQNNYVNYNNQKKKGLPKWAIVLMCVFGFIILAGLFGDSDTEKEESAQKAKTSSKDISIKLESDDITVEIGKTYEIKYSVSPEDAEIKKVEWSSSNKKIAKVTDGKVEGIKAGDTKITLNVNGQKKKIKVKVVEPKFEIDDNLTNMANTYYLNEARGNSTYFGKKVKVTATITDISVDESVLFNTGVTIHLKENGAKYTLLCNNDKGINGITNYNRGDKITVVGKMDTMVTGALVMKKCEIYSE